jgi:hypothetical protein
MTKGSCLCGAIQFEVTGTVQGVGCCHCSMCRKAHGTPFSTYTEVASEDLRVVSGEHHVRTYKSSEQVKRSFCDTCGASFTFRWGGLPAAVWVAAGLLEDDPGLCPKYHMFVGSKASWYEITDELPQHEAYPPPPSESQ